MVVYICNPRAQEVGQACVESKTNLGYKAKQSQKTNKNSKTPIR